MEIKIRFAFSQRRQKWTRFWNFYIAAAMTQISISSDIRSRCSDRCYQRRSNRRYVGGPCNTLLKKRTEPQFYKTALFNPYPPSNAKTLESNWSNSFLKMDRTCYPLFLSLAPSNTVTDDYKHSLIRQFPRLLNKDSRIHMLQWTLMTNLQKLVRNTNNWITFINLIGQFIPYPVR